jgi:hypothetical protein
LIKGIESWLDNYNECLNGNYRYVKEGILIGDYTKWIIPNQFLDKDFSLEDEAITVNATNAHAKIEFINPNLLRVFFKDKGLGKTTGKGEIHLLSSTQIRWVLKDGEILYSPGQDLPILGFSVPVDVVMNKVPVRKRP